MLTICQWGFGVLPGSTSLWYIVSLTLIWVWQERTKKTFLGKMKCFGGHIGLVLFLFSLGISSYPFCGLSITMLVWNVI